MREFSYTITKKENLHARPVGMLVRKAKTYASNITISANGKECSARGLMAVMALCVKCGTVVNVRVEGEDEENCAQEMEAFFRENL